ncbi:cytochrome b-c1 complex subunit 8 [Auriculariales sp. MPI-PUGE-AT-0066]|nr:cytochrome b-c1 complex subunit 8 [Auriculariales sp. MPI-PUGE-AT-0066]
MRPTQLIRSDMPGPKAYMGWWGQIGSHGQRGVVQYAISPYAQRPLAGMLHGYVFNGYRRIMKFVPYWIGPFAIGYGVYVWGDRRYEYLHSKAGHAESEEH